MPQGDFPLRDKGEREFKPSYPPESADDIKETSRDYKDQAASKLFVDAGGNDLMRASQELHNALLRQAEKLSQFHSTPFTKRSAQTILTSMETIERTQAAIERWHHLIYPNQSRSQ